MVQRYSKGVVYKVCIKFFILYQEEIMLPGPKVGLIIGKNGKTIKQLQEQSGAKMVVIQDGPNTEYVSLGYDD